MEPAGILIPFSRVGSFFLATVSLCGLHIFNFLFCNNLSFSSILVNGSLVQKSEL